MRLSTCHGGRSRARPVASVIIPIAKTVGAALALGCGGDGTSSPGLSNPGIAFRVVAGGGASDTVQAKLTQALVVEIRDSTGRFARGKTVRFEAIPPDDPKRQSEIAVAFSTLTGNFYSSFVPDVADSLGQAKARVAFGTFPGSVRARVLVPELGIAETVTFTVKPGAPFKFVIATRDTTVQPGATYSLNASLADRFSNPTPGATPTFASGPGIASVSATGQVTAGAVIARGKVVLSSGAVTDSAFVSVLPRLPMVAVRIGTLHTVVLVNIDGTGYSELATSSDRSLAPQAVKSGTGVVFHEGSPGDDAAVSIVSPGSAARVLAGPANGFPSAAWPRWAPDGAWVYFSGYRRSIPELSLWRIRPDGTQLDSLGIIADYGAELTVPAISPDGQTAVVSDYLGLRFITIATKASRVVRFACGKPRYSPDGTRLACIMSGAVSVMNVDGTGVRQLNAPGQFDDLSAVDWTPDGTWLIARSTQVNGSRLINATTGATLDLSAIGAFYLQASFVR